ncbi:hypothetical protein D3C81_1539560 [compost metagenome]
MEQITDAGAVDDLQPRCNGGSRATLAFTVVHPHQQAEHFTRRALCDGLGHRFVGRTNPAIGMGHYGGDGLGAAGHPQAQAWIEGQAAGSPKAGVVRVGGGVGRGGDRVHEALPYSSWKVLLFSAVRQGDDSSGSEI